MKLCVYGGQYGSEGKGSAAEWLLQNSRRDGKRLVAIGENSPNSGHTCSLGKTRNIPASSFFADLVVMGPDSAISYEVLHEDLEKIYKATGKVPPVFIHQHAAMVREADAALEKRAGVIDRISSTGSGSGAARALRKCYERQDDAIVGEFDMWSESPYDIQIVDRFEYLDLVNTLHGDDCVFECSQGTLLDVNWGIYPYVTSRTTLPRVAIERNGLATLQWAYFGVYRTYPIRTGGPSGPTGAMEVKFADIGVPDEVASVTKRIRRVFMFSPGDFQLSLNLTRPNCVLFTFLDYIKVDPADVSAFLSWLHRDDAKFNYRVEGLFLSNAIGKFVNHQVQDL